MHGRYEVADLLKLRESPLVTKPKSLPPVEEWMGCDLSFYHTLSTANEKRNSAVEPKRPITTRGKFDEGAIQTDGFQKRPALLDAAARRSTTGTYRDLVLGAHFLTLTQDAGGIHLGPPRNSFASSNATRNRNGAHERTKTNEDSDARFNDRRTGNLGGPNGKFGAKGDAESDGSDRLRRRTDDDEHEARPRKDHDRPKWGTRDSQINGDKIDEPGSRNARDTKEKFSQPWVRREKTLDHDDSRRESPAWRRGQKDRDNERQDADPEWIDSVETPEPAKQHTHEDFLRWKESMTGKPAGDSKSTTVEDSQEKMVEANTGSHPRIVSDPIASGDKFFAKFEETKGNARPTKSRFASIFGPKEQPKAEMESPTSSLIPAPVPAELEQPGPPAESEKKVDADFAKLLAMLSKNEGSQAVKPRPPRSPVNIVELASARSPDITSNNAVPTQSTRTPASHTPQMSLDRLIETRSPGHHEQPALAKPGAQELLELLQRSNLQDRQEQRQPNYAPPEQRAVLPPPGLSAYQDRDRSGPALISTRRETPRSIFDDPAFLGYRGEAQQYRPQQVPARNDPGGIESLLAAMNKSYMPSNVPEPRAGQNPQVPPGLQRPPGLESRPPPGWSASAPQVQRQTSQHVLNYNLVPQQNLFSAQNQPGYGQQQHQPQRDAQRLPQRKATGDLQTYGNYPPPGFGPSPAYASLGSPDQYGPMRNEYAFSERLGSRERLERQPQLQNPYAPPYGNASGGRGNGGGVQLPPGFR